MINPPSRMPENPQETPEGTCEGTGYYFADVSLPIGLKPMTSVGKIETKCCGAPEISCTEDCCGDICEIIITQKVKITIPVKYGFKSCIGRTTVECMDECNEPCNYNNKCEDSST